MASFADETMAVADVYASGVLRVAKEKGEQDDVVAQFSDLIAYMDQHPEFDRFLTAASVDEDPREESLEKLFRGKMGEPLLNLLLVLNHRNRLELVRSVFKAVQIQVEAELQQRRVLVESAMPLTDDLKARIKDVMSRRLGKEALVNEQINPGLIGGIVIHVGDERYDASLAQQVRAVQQRLADRAGREIYQGDGKYIKES